MATLVGDIFGNTLRGADGDDFVIGLGGDDVLNGGNGNDLIIGDDGNDFLNGGNDDDTLIGGSGEDILNMSAGNDLIFGGSDDDVFQFDEGSETTVTIADFASGDIIDLSGTDIFTPFNEEFGVFEFEGDTVLFVGASVITLTGYTNSDFLQEDILFGRQDGSNEADLFIGTSSSEHFRGLDGDDIIEGKAGNDRLLGSAGDDLIYGGGDDDFVAGGRDNDTLFGNSGDDELIGWLGDDILKGGRGDDLLFGNDGMDTLEGGKGNDILEGGLDADVFQFRQAGVFDRITDFEDGVDTIEVMLNGVNSVADITQTSLGFDLVLQMGTTTVSLDGLSGTVLTSDDFIF